MAPKCQDGVSSLSWYQGPVRLAKAFATNFSIVKISLITKMWEWQCFIWEERPNYVQINQNKKNWDCPRMYSRPIVTNISNLLFRAMHWRSWPIVGKLDQSQISSKHYPPIEEAFLAWDWIGQELRKTNPPSPLQKPLAKKYFTNRVNPYCLSWFWAWRQAHFLRVSDVRNPYYGKKCQRKLRSKKDSLSFGNFLHYFQKYHV